MEEIHEPGVLKTPKPRRKVKITDIIIFGVLILISVLLVTTIISKLTLKHDVAQAQIVSDKAIADIQKRDGTAVYKLGSTEFKKTSSAEALTKQFKAVEVATLKSPKLVRTMVYNDGSGRTVYFLYEYTALKVPFYIRIGAVDNGGQWKITSVSGNADASKLILN